MRFYTFGIKFGKPIIVEITMEITKNHSEKTNVDFTVINMGNDIKKSLINASNLFAKTNLSYFEKKDIKIKVISSENYSSPFLTSLFYCGLVCDHYNVKPPKVLIAGDILQNGSSSGFKFQILEQINKENLFLEYDRWINMSSSDLLKSICAIKIQRNIRKILVKKQLRQLRSDILPNNYTLKVIL